MSNLEWAMGSSTRAAIETLLLEHLEVASASLNLEEAADGRSYPVAYVVPDPARMREARMRIYQADKDSRVSQWKKAFDQTYRAAVTDPTPSFVGWTSCYTNKPLPEPEMQEWLACTTNRIRSLRPEHVLEIGCGVGLLVQPLAPHCISYRGTDLSPVAIAGLRDFVASVPELRHVELIEREAVDLHDQPAHSVDTVIINSVIQYFPDLAYLRSVIAEAARVVKSGGRIFIGDVRDFGSLHLFHSAAQLAKAPPNASAGWLKRRISLAVEQERELAIDPQFFLELADSDPRIHSVEVLPKRGKVHNELNRYRYDVVLHVGETADDAPQPDIEWQGGDHSIAEIVSQFETGRFTSVAIRNVMNRRLAEDIAGMQQLWSADDQQGIGTIRDSLAAKDQPSDLEDARDPEDFWVLSHTGLCDVRLSWPPHSTDGRFDVILTARDRAPSTASPSRDSGVAPLAPGRLATDPLEAAYKQQLGLALHQILRERLPEELVPAGVFVVDALPSGEPKVPPGLAAHLVDGGAADPSDAAQEAA